MLRCTAQGAGLTAALRVDLDDQDAVLRALGAGCGPDGEGPADRLRGAALWALVDRLRADDPSTHHPDVGAALLRAVVRLEAEVAALVASAVVEVAGVERAPRAAVVDRGRHEERRVDLPDLGAAEAAAAAGRHPLSGWVGHQRSLAAGCLTDLHDAAATGVLTAPVVAAAAAELHARLALGDGQGDEVDGRSRQEREGLARRVARRGVDALQARTAGQARRWVRHQVDALLTRPDEAQREAALAARRSVRLADEVPGAAPSLVVQGPADVVARVDHALDLAAWYRRTGSSDAPPASDPSAVEAARAAADAAGLTHQAARFDALDQACRLLVDSLPGGSPATGGPRRPRPAPVQVQALTSTLEGRDDLPGLLRSPSDPQGTVRPAPVLRRLAGTALEAETVEALLADRREASGVRDEARRAAVSTQAWHAPAEEVRDDPMAGLEAAAGLLGPVVGPSDSVLPLPPDVEQVEVDPATGEALGRGPAAEPVDRYRPSAAQARQVRTRWPTCADPSCSRASHHCDLDHVQSWRPGDQTHADGLVPLCRHHHLLKTHGGWRYDLLDDGTLEVSTPGGTRRRSPVPDLLAVVRGAVDRGPPPF